MVVYAKNIVIGFGFHCVYLLTGCTVVLERLCEMLITKH